MSKRMHAMCLGFNSSKMIREAITLFEKQNEDQTFVQNKLLVDCRYPAELITGEKDHSYKLMELAKEFNWNYVRPLKNYSVAGNWNWVIRELGLKEGDVLYGADPDGRPQQFGYLKTMLDVFNTAPEAYTLQLNRYSIYADLSLGAREKQIGQHWLLEYPRLISWSLGAFDVGWLMRCGGFIQDAAQYGFCEHAISRQLAPLGGKFYMLRDFYDNHLTAEDPLYTQWKQASASYNTSDDFEAWLRKR